MKVSPAAGGLILINRFGDKFNLVGGMINCAYREPPIKS